MRERLLSLAAVAVALGAASMVESNPRELAWDELKRRLTGRFSSEAQSREDPDYAEIRFEAVPVWPDRGRWLYVERSVPGRRELPYRQAVLKLGDPDEAFSRGRDRKFELTVYALSDPRRFAGAALDPEKLAALTPSDLAAKEGCAIVLVQGDDGAFAGGTRARDCRDDATGASYVTSEWVIGRDGFNLWDRGYDARGRQIWGATKGPYTFRRLAREIP